MAKTLLETLKESQVSTVKTPQPAQDQRQLQSILTTKATGAAAPAPSGPAASSQAAKMGIQAGMQAQQEQALSGRLQDLSQLEQARAQEAQLARGEAAALQTMEQMKQTFENRAQAALQDMGMRQAEMTDQDRANQLENTTRLMRLANSKYVDDINRAGRELRLDEELTAKEELARVQMRDALAALKDETAYRKMMNATEREWNMEMAQMDINTAMEMAMQAANAENQRAKYESLGGLFSGGAQAAAAYQRDKSTDEANVGDFSTSNEVKGQSLFPDIDTSPNPNAPKRV